MKTSRTISRFKLNGEKYTIEQRSTPLSNGSLATRRFVCDAQGDWQGWANGVRDARKVLNQRQVEQDALADLEKRVTRLENLAN